MCALIPAAGRAVRYGATAGKLFEQIHGRSVLDWTLSVCAASGAFDQLVIVAPADSYDHFVKVVESFDLPLPWVCVLGGDSRQESVRAGLRAVRDADIVVVHDAARPAVQPGDFDRVISAARSHGAAIVAVPVADTLVRASHDAGAEWVSESVDRDRIWAVQTPQAFKTSLLRSAHDAAFENKTVATDDAGLVRALGHPVELVAGTGANPKLTRPADKMLMEALLNPSDLQRRESNVVESPRIRVGYGYDVHRFAPGRPLWLGGVHFPDAAQGLLGHSDADVLLHALCDALLGAAGLGDIGHQFPDNDPAHRNRASIEFLHETNALVRQAGWNIANVDVSVLAEAPRIGPRIEEMRERIAVALQINPGTVGIKATTNEGMGFVGRSEGIAAHAVALLIAR